MRHKSLRLVLFAMILAFAGAAMLQGREAGTSKPPKKPALRPPPN